MADGADGSAAKAAAKTASGADGVVGRLGELAWRALPAIGSAVGFVGFVAVIGAAIEWIRFDAAHLPATQAVLAVPKQELVVEGARALIVFVVVAVLAVLLVYLIDSKGNATPRTARGLVLVGALGLLLAVALIRGDHGAGIYVLLFAAVVWITLVAFYVVGLAMLDFRRRTKLKQARDRVIAALLVGLKEQDARTSADKAESIRGSVLNREARAKAHGAATEARKQLDRAIKEWNAAAQQVINLHSSDVKISMEEQSDLGAVPAGDLPGRVELEVELDEAERALGRVFGAILGQALVVWEDPHPIQKSIQVLALCLGVAIVTLMSTHAPELPQQVLILALVVVLLTTMNIFVARATDKFAWYGISVFFSVLMFGAALTIASTLEQPTAQPIALVRKDNEVGVCGVYVTQTSDRVYMGRLPLSNYRPGFIFWVPTSAVDLVSIGHPVRIGSDGNRPFSAMAEHMLDRLYKDRPEEAAPTLKNETISEVGKKPASNKQAKRISGLHVVTNTETREVPIEKPRSKRHAPVTIDGESCTATQEVVAARRRVVKNE